MSANNNKLINSIDKIKYYARRGMLELDVILTPYLENYYIKDNNSNKELFIEFLNNDDFDILNWIFKVLDPPKKYVKLINRIIFEKNKYNNKLFSNNK